MLQGCYNLVFFIWDSLIPRSSPCTVYSHFVNSHTVNSHCQFPFGQLPIWSTPMWSMLTKWELTKWELGKLTILYNFDYCYRSGKCSAHQSNLLSGDVKTVWVMKQLSIRLDSKTLSLLQQASEVSNIASIQEEIEFRGEWTQTAH